MTIVVRSSGFENGAVIPMQYTQDGSNVSPPLRWSDIPETAEELAVIADDPDAPTAEPWVHWVMYGISATVQGLPQGIEKGPKPRGVTGAMQGINTNGTIGYDGPAPPPGHGPHTYHFKVYALDTELDVDPGLSKNALLASMEGHILAQGELTGIYER